MTNLKAVISAVLMSSVMGVASAKTLTIGIDISASSPVITSPEFAKAAAENAGGRIASLAPGDSVVLRKLGDGGLDNISSKRFRVTRLARADKIANTVGSYIKSLPAARMQGQGGTNLVAFLEFGRFDCAAGDEILFITDGVESSAYVSAAKFIAGKKLPAPEKNFLAGCTVTMVGFGRSSDGEMNPESHKGHPCVVAGLDEGRRREVQRHRQSIGDIMNNYDSGGISKGLARLGNATGFAAALLVTPAIWVRTRDPLFDYYSDAWGPEIGRWCTWGTGVLEAFALFAGVSFGVILLVSWLIAKRAAASFVQ